MNTENKPEMQAPARVPEFHFARLMHEDGIVVRSQYRSGGKIRREVQARLRIELTRETVRAVHEAPMVLAAVDTYMAALAAHHAKCEEIEARADEEHNDRVARWERDCQVADDRGEERPPRPKRLEPTKPKPPKLHEYKVHARSIEATKDDPQGIGFEVVGVDGAELYRMGRLRMDVRGCPVLRAVADRIDLIVTVRGEVTEDEWALLEATQRESVQAVSPYVDPDGSGQLVWNEALDTVPALRVVQADDAQNMVQFSSTTPSDLVEAYGTSATLLAIASDPAMLAHFDAHLSQQVKAGGLSEDSAEKFRDLMRTARATVEAHAHGPNA